MKKTNLRFLLALGNTKVVVLKDPENTLQIYTGGNETDKKVTVTAEHISEALSAK